MVLCRGGRPKPSHFDSGWCIIVVCPDDILGCARNLGSMDSMDTSSSLGHPSKTNYLTMRRAFLPACWHSSPWLAAQAVSTVSKCWTLSVGTLVCFLLRDGLTWQVIYYVGSSLGWPRYSKPLKRSKPGFCPKLLLFSGPDRDQKRSQDVAVIKMVWH